MSEDQKLKSPERRSFFKKAGVGIGAVGAAAVGISAVSTDAESTGIDKDHKAASYRETDHVKQAYETARF
jgi:hypothetical protein